MPIDPKKRKMKFHRRSRVLNLVGGRRLRWPAILLVSSVVLVGYLWQNSDPVSYEHDHDSLKADILADLGAKCVNLVLSCITPKRPPVC